MKKHYTKEEVEILMQNPNIKMIKYGNQIEYKDSFKKWAVVQSLRHPELSANQIFEMAGFDLDIIGRKLAKARINYWKKNNKDFEGMTKEYKKIKTQLDNKNNSILEQLTERVNKLLDCLGKKNGKN